MTHVVAAEYVSSRNPLWSGNPLIEVLGDIAPSEAFIKYMARGVQNPFWLVIRYKTLD
jgi:hypothetical protein